MLMACNSRMFFHDVSSADFEREWNLSAKNSIVSWWFAGEHAGYYYVVEKRAIATQAKRFRISKQSVRFKEVPEMGFTMWPNKWFNLKDKNVSFDHP